MWSESTRRGWSDSEAERRVWQFPGPAASFDSARTGCLHRPGAAGGGSWSTHSHLASVDSKPKQAIARSRARSLIILAACGLEQQQDRAAAECEEEEA